MHGHERVQHSRVLLAVLQQAHAEFLTERGPVVSVYELGRRAAVPQGQVQTAVAPDQHHGAAEDAAQPAQRPGLSTGCAALDPGFGPALAEAGMSIGHGLRLQQHCPDIGRLPGISAPTGQS
jgi:hypothetical protein